MPKNLELNFIQGEKVCISPLGDVSGVDGRFYRISAATVFKAMRTHIPLFVNHDDYREAAGWFNKDTLEARADGIYASLELTPLGQTLVTNKSYRYLSPTYYVDDMRNVTEIESVGLVNLPNLLFKELNQKGAKPMSQTNTTLPTVTTTPMLNVNPVKEDNAAQELAAIKAENARLAHENKTHSINAKIAAGELFEAQRELALTLDDNAIGQLVLSNQKMALSGGRLPALKTPDGKIELNEAQKRTCVQLGITEAEFQAQIEA
jgi:phage I-like protein